jgi:hypothetical protein
MSDESVVTDVDWEGERRWHDRVWVRIVVVVVVYAVVIGVWSLWLPDNPGGLGGGVAACGGVVWQTLALRRQVAQEAGLERWQVPVAARRLRQGWIPRDPAARAAMAALVRRQRRAVDAGRWWNPVFALVLVGLGVGFWATGETVLGPLALVLAIVMGVGTVAGRRAVRRLDRIDDRLAPPSAPAASSSVEQ